MIAPLPTIKSRWLDVSFWIAGSNWEMWLLDYAYSGPPSGLPVLANTGRFLAFVSEYNLFQRQTIVARLTACSGIIAGPTLLSAFSNPSGADIDTLAISLKKLRVTIHLEISLLSKLVAFYDPGNFNARDQSAERGLNIWTSGTYRVGRSTYQDYCTNINNVLNGPLGIDIDTYIIGRSLPNQATPQTFRRRMLDVYLMIEGGRWSRII